MMERPLPCQSSISACAFSKTAVGNAAGPSTEVVRAHDFSFQSETQ